MNEIQEQFKQRKKDHIRIALDSDSQAFGLSGLDKVRLVHEAIPDIDFSEIDISIPFLSKNFEKKNTLPLFVSSMTAGHEDGEILNRRLAQACSEKGWPMGVGSQRRELYDLQAGQEWKSLRSEFPDVILIGNLGITQIINTPISLIQKLIDNLEASALFVHFNSLQECLQPEGTPQFRGGLQALKLLAKNLSVPLIVKEVGSGFSQKTLERLIGSGIYAVDLSGLGGTHWGRVEGYRSSPGELLYETAKTFHQWGQPTLDSMLGAIALKEKLDYKIWASGGVRSGLDAAKLFALGGEMVGFAQPVLKAALEGLDALRKLLTRYEYELKVALFCTGCAQLNEFREKKVWEWIS